MGSVARHAKHLRGQEAQTGLVHQRRRLQGVAGTLPAHVMVGQPMQFGLHQRDQLLQRSLVSAAPVAEQLGDLSSRGWGRRQYKLLDAANSSMVEGFLQHGRRAIKKNCALVAGFRRPFRFGR